MTAWHLPTKVILELGNGEVWVGQTYPAPRGLHVDSPQCLPRPPGHSGAEFLPVAEAPP